MPHISDLIPDIERMLGGIAKGGSVELPEEQVASFGAQIGAALVKMLKKRRSVKRTEKKLYMSELGKPCIRQLWYDYNQPEKGEPLQPHTLVKFLIGDITEAVMLLLAKVAGHTVEDEQARLEIEGPDGWKITGRKDAKIDGALVDVKSASKYSFEKFKEGLSDENDAFGYRTQLDSYAYAEDFTGDAGFFVMNKETGKMFFAHHDISTADMKDHIALIASHMEEDEPPPRHYDDFPEGKSGNRKLGVNCSYCPHKAVCWPGLRAFAYARGPVFLTEVKKLPDVPEIFLDTKDSKFDIEEMLA